MVLKAPFQQLINQTVVIRRAHTLMLARFRSHR